MSDSQKGQPERRGRLGRDEKDDQQNQQRPEPGVQQMLAGEDQGSAGHQALQFGEGDDRAGKGDGADRHADCHLDETAAVDRTPHADPVSFGKGEGGRGDADSSKADKAVERRDQLRQCRHLNAQRDIGPDRTADQNADSDQPKADDMRGNQGGDHRDHHAGDPEDVAGPCGLRGRQTAQGQDEADRSDQIEEGGQGVAHRGPASAFSGTSGACAG